jgi:hypothetical protein
MSLKLDSTGDVNYQIIDRLAKTYDLPDYVKQASQEETLNPAELPSSAYADNGLRQFPCHTKAACYVSSLFFLEHAGQLSEQKRELVRQRLTKFAEDFGIAADVMKADGVRRSLRQQEKESSWPDSAFAIVETRPDGSKDRRYPLRSGAEVQKAASWLLQHRDRFTFAERHKLATAILDKAAEFNVAFETTVDYELEKQAGRGTYDPAEAASMLRGRAYLQGVPQPAKEQLQKLAMALDANPLLAEDPSTTLELAKTVDQFDRVHHLTAKYAEGLCRPEDVLFAGSLKYASEFVKNACHMLTGSIYQKEQFAKLSLASVRDAFGDELARDVSTGLLVDPTKMAEVASTLPLPDAQLLDQLMKAAGEDPAAVKAAEFKPSEAERRQLAALYAIEQRGTPVGHQPTGVRGSHVVGR